MAATPARFNTGSNLDIEKDAEGVHHGQCPRRRARPGRQWSIEVWAQNVFNAKYMQVAFNAPLQGSGTQRGVDAGFYPSANSLYIAFLGEPRTFGVTLRGKPASPGRRRALCRSARAAATAARAGDTDLRGWNRDLGDRRLSGSAASASSATAAPERGERRAEARSRRRLVAA